MLLLFFCRFCLSGWEIFLVSIPSLLCFYPKWVLILLCDFFSTSCGSDHHMVLFYSLLRGELNINWSSNVKLTFHPWDKHYLVIMLCVILFIYCWVQFAEVLRIQHPERYCSIVFVSCSVFVRFWIRIKLAS